MITARSRWPSRPERIRVGAIQPHGVPATFEYRHVAIRQYSLSYARVSAKSTTAYG